jgi:hypothetical protein
MTTKVSQRNSYEGYSRCCNRRLTCSHRFCPKKELAKLMRDAELDGEYDDDGGSESVSTLQSTEDGIVTDFEALADVEVEEGHGELVIEDDK